MRRTRLGKVIGSVRANPEGWVYWPERNWSTNEPGFQVVAPSGSRMGWFAVEADAVAKVEQENRDWFGSRP